MMKKGFTLIELLIVITIISVLSVVITVNVNKARIKSKDAKRKGDLTLIASALELYKTENKSYPKNITNNCWIKIGRTGYEQNCSWLGGALTANDPGKPNFTSIISPYIASLPVDPLNTGNYMYELYIPAGETKYYLRSRLENISDSELNLGKCYSVYPIGATPTTAEQNSWSMQPECS